MKTGSIWPRSSRPSRSRATPSSVDALERGEPTTVLFDVEGMTCATCAVRVERVLSRHEGVASASVSLAAATAAVEIDGAEEGVQLLEVKSLESQPGLGVTGTVKGHETVEGSPELMESRGLRRVDRWEETLASKEATGHTSFLAGWDGLVRGVVALSDPVRAESAEAVARLNRLGIATELATGDNQEAARRVADEVGIDSVIARATPESKADRVRSLQEEGHVVAFFGDGVNDAPALTQADVGLAVGSGTGVAVKAGDVVLLRDDPRLAPAAVELARATFATIRGNLIWAFLYNTLAIPIAALGLLSPTIAAGAMAFSSISVVLNALRLRRFDASPA